MRGYESLEAEVEVYPVTPIDPACSDYVEERRKLLGPIADISHPEFGRENTDEENVKLETIVVQPDKFVVEILSEATDSEGIIIASDTYYARLQ